MSLRDFHFTMMINKASPKLMLACAEGEHIKKAVLTCRKAGGGQEKFHQITLTEAYVAMHHITGAAGTDNNMETFALAYGSIKQEYFKQSTEGTTTSAGAKTWDLRKNLAS